MKTNNFVKAEEVIRVLNVDPPSPSSYYEFLERYAAGAHLETAADEMRSLRVTESLDTPRSGDCSWFTSNYLLRAPTIVAPSLSTEKGWRLPETISTEESWPIADALVSAHLRELADELIDTGRLPDGSERPKDRMISRAQHAWLAVDIYLGDNPMTFAPILGIDGFSLDVAQPRWKVPGASDFFTAQIQSALRLFIGVLASD
jgi:hypothetical protein